MEAQSLSSPSVLIIVCCHATWLPSSAAPAQEPERIDEAGQWLIAPYQNGETATFTEHIKTGLQLLIDQPESLLVFSGGPTRRETQLSEARSYAQFAKTHEYWGIVNVAANKSSENRILLEERALDSFQNVLFSLIRFYDAVRRWPKSILIISHGFKRARFLDLHCPTLRIPPCRIRYIGIDPVYFNPLSPEYNPHRVENVRQSEWSNGVEPWKRDNHGIEQFLREKRQNRNMWNVSQSIFTNESLRRFSLVETEMVAGTEILSQTRQPWEHPC